MDTAASGFELDGMLEVQHLVIQKVFDREARRVGAVENTADDDSVVGSVIVTEHAASVVCAPGKSWLAEKSVKETSVEGIEDLIEVKVMADRSQDSFASASLANVLCLARDGFGGDVAAVAVSMQGRDGFAVKLREENVCDGMMNVRRSVFEQIGQANVKTAFAKPDRRVQ